MIIEAVPNVSEGRDARTLAAIASAARAVPGATLADIHADPDHHRAVLSLLGAAPAVEAAALALVDAALAAIDMRVHHGRHPRIGAVDVLPFVPLEATMADAVAMAHRVGRAIAGRHALPVYYYGAAATVPSRRRLPDVRRGGYEALAARLRTPEGQPDDGPARFDPRAGAVLVGARPVLIAFNVWLDSEDLQAACDIARAVRERDGGLPGVQALGLALPSWGLVQVSMNLVDHRATPIPRAFDAVAEEAARRGIRVRRGELVGLAPWAAFAGRDPVTVGLGDFRPSMLLDTWLASAPGGQ